MNYKSFAALVKQNKIPPICYLYGEEDFIKNEAIKKIVEMLVPESMQAFNYTHLYGEEIDGSGLLNSVQALPMMSQKRVVLVQRINKYSESKHKALLSYLEKPSETTCLLLDSDSAKPKGKIFSLCKKKKWDIEFKPLYENELPSWVARRLKKYQKTAGEKEIPLLINFIGGNLRALDNELNKICIFIGDRDRIEVEDIEQVAGFSKRYTVFELCKHLGIRNIDQSIFILQKMLEYGEEPLRILFGLISYFSKLWKTHELKANNLSKQELSARIGVHSFFMQEYLVNSSKYSVENFRAIFQAFLETDRNIKRSYLKPQLLLELLTHKICTTR